MRMWLVTEGKLEKTLTKCSGAWRDRRRLPGWLWIDIGACSEQPPRLWPAVRATLIDPRICDCQYGLGEKAEG
jgi:hypothetical protein